MPRYRFDIQQNTEEWEAIKIGKFSASSADKLLMDKSNKGYIQLIDKIIEERITGQPTESRIFTGNQFTERGHELEPVARDDYDMRHFSQIQTIGVVELDEWVLCSPDGLLNNDGLWQAKCPIFNTHRAYLNKINQLRAKGFLDNEILKKIALNYYKQMQFELFVSEREYNVFNSFHPSLPPIDIIIKRDNAMIDQIKQRLYEAKAEVTAEIEKIKLLV